MPYIIRSLSYIIFFFLFLLFDNNCFGADGNEWKIGGKIHFEEQSSVDYIGTLELNKLTREILKEFFDIKSDTCANNAKVLIKKENGNFFIKHYEERSKPGVGEEMHATLLYTSKRSDDGHETLKDVCNNLAINDKTLSCGKAPTIEQVAKAYQKLIKPNWKFEISDVVFITSKTANVIIAKLLFNGRDEILNKEGKPVSGGFLHMTLLNIDSSVVSEKEKINQVVIKLKKNLSGKMVKIGNKNGQADLEFGMSGSKNRLRP